jgi:hypothetical protein
MLKEKVDCHLFLEAIETAQWKDVSAITSVHIASAQV